MKSVLFSLLILTIMVISCSLAQQGATKSTTTATTASTSSSRSPSDYFSSQDVDSLKQLVTSSKRDDGSFGSLENTFYAVNLSINPRYRDLAKLIDSSLTCQFAKKHLNNRESVENLFYAISIIENLNCGSEVGKDIRTVLENGLQSSKIADKYYAVNAIRRLQSASHIQFDDAEWSSVVRSIANFQESDGSFKSDSETTTQKNAKGTSSALNAGYAYHILAQTPVASEDEDTIGEVAESVDSLFSAATEDLDAEEGGNVYFTGGSALDNLKATALVFSGANLLIRTHGEENLKSAVSTDAVVGIANYALGNYKRVSNLREAYYLNLLLNALSDNQWHSPLVVTLSTNSVNLSSKEGAVNPTIRVTDLYGEQVTDAKVLVSKIYSVENQKQVLASNQEATVDSKDKTLYTYNLLGLKPEPGYYALDLTVTPSAKSGRYSTAVKDTRNVKVVSSIQVVDLDVKVSQASKEDADKQNVDTYTATYPNGITTQLNLNSSTRNQQVIVSFGVKNPLSGKSVKVHQAFIRFTHENGDENVFVAKYNAKTSKYEVKIPLSGKDSTFKNRVSGKHQINLLIGDPFASNAVAWNIATANVDFGSSEGTRATRSANRSGSRREPLPEIHHMFRPAEKRPVGVISLVFAGLAVAPILVLLAGILRVGGNLNNLPGGSGAIFSLGFFVSFGAILGLFVVYWFVLNIVQTLGYLALLSVPTVLFGLKTLQAVYLNRTKSHSD